MSPRRTRKQRRQQRRKSHRKSQNQRRRKTIRRMRGGNYATDVTTRTFENMPMKPLNKTVTTVPGYGVMSAAAYLQLKEDLDRNGKHFYD